MYGGKARNLFRRTIVKSAWFSVISAQMNSQGGTTVDFGSEYQAVFSRTADYILNCMLNTHTHTHTHARAPFRMLSGYLTLLPSHHQAGQRSSFQRLKAVRRTIRTGPSTKRCPM